MCSSTGYAKQEATRLAENGNVNYVVQLAKIVLDSKWSCNDGVEGLQCSGGLSRNFHNHIGSGKNPGNGHQCKMLLRSSCWISEIHLKYCAVNVGSKTHRVPSGIFEHYNCWGTENIECHLESLDITKRLLAVSGLGTPALVYCPTYDIMSCNCCRGSLHYCPTYDIMSCNCCRASASAPSC